MSRKEHRMLVLILTLSWVILLGVILSESYAQEQKQIAQELFDSYPAFMAKEITSQRFTQAELLSWLKPMKEQNVFDMKPMGQSAEGRTIWLLKRGEGKTTVMLWSQMHGDEATATMAMVDMLRFFARVPQHQVVRTIQERLTLLLIPMVNPDGAECFERRTAQLIDMNRDALVVGTPEAQALKGAWDTYRPKFAFNLHDQDPRTAVGSTKKVSTIALLAPAYNEAREDNHVRRPAKQVAATIAAVMAQFVPGHVSKYDDTFEPRAFGDNIQKWGTSTILVESGGWPGDPEKMFIRKLNFVGLLTALFAIASEQFQQADTGPYEQLPFNTENFYDLILRNALVKVKGSLPPIRADIGINIDEERDPSTGLLTRVGKVMNIGDLSTFGSFEEVDLGDALIDGVITQLEQKLTLNEISSLRIKK